MPESIPITPEDPVPMKPSDAIKVRAVELEQKVIKYLLSCGIQNFEPLPRMDYNWIALMEFLDIHFS